MIIKREEYERQIKELKDKIKDLQEKVEDKEKKLKTDDLHIEIRDEYIAQLSKNLDNKELLIREIKTHLFSNDYGDKEIRLKKLKELYFDYEEHNL